MTWDKDSNLTDWAPSHPQLSFQCPHMAVKCQRALWCFFYKDTNQIHENSTHDLIVFQRPHFQIPPHWTLAFNIWILEECTQFIADSNDLSLIWWCIVSPYHIINPKATFLWWEHSTPSIVATNLRKWAINVYVHVAKVWSFYPAILLPQGQRLTLTRSQWGNCVFMYKTDPEASYLSIT